MFGRGWSSPFEMRLKRDLEGYRMIPESGDGLVCWDDRVDRVTKGERLTNFGAFCDLERIDDKFVVTEWSPTSGEIKRYIFGARDFGQWMPLVGQYDGAGNGVDITHDSAGRVSEIILSRERRRLRVGYDDNDRAMLLRLICPPDVSRGESTSLVGDSTEPATNAVFPDHQRDVCRYEYDDAGLLCRFEDALGQKSYYEYDDAGRMVREVNTSGMEFRFRFDSQGRCVETCGANNYRRTTLEFFDDANLTRVSDSLDNVTSYTWNDSGQVTERMQPLGDKWRTDFDEFGRVIAEQSPAGTATSHRYDANGNRDKTTNAAGEETSIIYDDKHRPTNHVDEAGHVWVRAYDSTGRLTSITPPIGELTTLTYNAHGDLQTLDAPDGGTFRYDAHGNLIEFENKQGHITNAAFDEEGYSVGQSDRQGNWTYCKRDLLGRVTRIILADESERSLEYDGYGQTVRLVDFDQSVTSWNYDIAGELLHITRPGGATVSFEKSTEAGRILAVTNEKGETYRFEYNANGDVLNREDFSGSHVAYEYDEMGAMVASFDEDHIRTGFERDALGRITKTIYADGTEVTYGYDSRGFLTQANNGNSLVEREFDALGRLTLERQGKHEISRAVDTDTGALSRASSLGYISSVFQNDQGLVTSIQTRDSSPVHFRYDEIGREIRRFIPKSIEVAQAFDLRGRCVEQKVGRISGLESPMLSPIVGRDYEYGSRNHPTKVCDSRLGEAQYSYDVEGQIVAATLPGNRKERFSYDAARNQTSYSGPVPDTQVEYVAGEQVSYSSEYDAGNLLVKRGNYRYDYNHKGQLTAKVKSSMSHRHDGSGEEEATRFRWNDMGQLVGVILPNGDRWEYSYDALGRRLKKVGPSETFEFVWDGDVMLHELRTPHATGDEEASTQIRTWEYNPTDNTPLWMLHDGKRYLCVNDLAGNPRELISEDGDIVWSATYSTWGTAWIDKSEDVDCPIRFQGQHYDAETGLHYNRFRYYDPQCGRYISADPIGLLGGINEFAYGANTISSTDPLGLANRTCGEDPIPNRLGTLSADGGLYGRIIGGVFHMEGKKQAAGKFDYVVTQQGAILIGHRHTKLSGGAPVLAAGEMRVRNGVIVNINGMSGHYWPTLGEAGNFLRILAKYGANVDRATLSLYDTSRRDIPLSKQIFPNSRERGSFL